MSDARILYGWVESASSDELTASIQTAGDIAVGDRLAFEIEGKSSTVLLQAVLVQPLVRRFGTFRIVDISRVADASNAPRIRTEGLTITLHTECGDIDGQVLDISLGGAGIELETSLDVGAVLPATFQSGDRQVEAAVEVRYCRSIRDDLFRIGVKIGEMSRVHSARWAMLLDEAA